MFIIIFYSFIIQIISKKIEIDLTLNPYKFPYLTQNYFLLPITINNISYSLQVDTSLSTTWVPHTKYNYDILKAPTYSYPYPNNIDKTKIESIEDENGEIEGILIEKNKNNDNNENKVVLNGNEFSLNYLMAYKYDDDYCDYFNGKMGLGFKFKKSEYNIINMLKFNNMIDEKIFSIDSKGKKIIFGDEKRYNFSCDVLSTEDLDDVYRDGWVCEMKYFNVEEDYKKINIEKFFHTKNYVIFDSAHDFITIPYKFKNKLNELLKKKIGLKCWDNKNEIEKIDDLDYENKTNFTDYLKFNRDDDYYDFFCDLKYINSNATLSFIIGKNLVRIPLFSLFYELNKTVMKSYINFIDEEDDGIFIVGWNFFQNFKMFFDYDEKKVGFENENSFYIRDVENEVEKLDEFYKKIEESENKKKKIILIVVAVVVILIALVVGLYFWVKKRTMNQNGPLIELENDDRLE